uniref:Intersectin 2a n=1 Tax=Esox lucius TaxID=8010 RepID=A0A6Q2YKK9_ESOLU
GGEQLPVCSVNIWSISPEERLKHDTQFDSLTPVLGHLSGEQAKKFFLQSGLPPQVLAEIWSLADMNDDGKMDRLEFSIAMKLIKITLQGRGLPPSLPTSMKQPPTVTPPSMMTSSTRFGMGSMPNLSVGMSTMLTPVPLNPSLPPLVPMPMTLPLMSGLANGNANLLTPSPMVTNSGNPSPTPCSQRQHASTDTKLFLNSSNSSSTTSLASNSNSPKTGSCDWSVPQASRLKYRQQFNGLDKLMTGYLSGPQVKNVLTASNLTQTQLATIWTLADVDKDGQLRAEEFILAMHLVDMAKTGCPLPLTLPSDLVPPSFRLKANFARGSAELEKRRMALEEEQRREKERREREARQLKERREKEAQEQENRKRAEEERRREMERRVEEDRQREKERKEVTRSGLSNWCSLTDSHFIPTNNNIRQELERQQKEEWERGRKDDLCRRRAGEQQEIAVLRAKKKQLQMELEAVDLREQQGKQQAVLEDLCRVKELKLRELERRREEERERKRREEEEEAARSFKDTHIFICDMESRRCREEEEDKKRTADQMERGGALHPSLNVERSLTLISYRALYPFTARSANDSTSKNAAKSLFPMMQVDDETVGEPGWLCGSYRGNRGWFPQSYAERCPVPALPEAPAAPGHTLLPPFGLTAPPNVTSGKQDQWFSDVSQRRLGWKYMIKTQFEKPSLLFLIPLCSVQSEYVALYTYESPEVGDLTFSEGDVVMVTEREGEWWRGCIGDQTGVFPSNYVKQVTASKKPEIAQSVSAVVALTTEQLSLSPGQLIVVLAKNTTGWWLGELQARGKKRQRGWFHSSHVKLLGPTSSKMSPATVPVCKVIAKYDYTAANQDEMSFFKGQLINILDKDNPDWWKGEVNGVTGLLPTNYVTVTTDSDPSQQWCADLVTLDSMTPSERKRQGYIHELIHTEQTYLDDLELVMEVFYKPMSVSGHLTEDDMAVIFVNWSELITCNSRLLRSLHALKAEGGANMPVQLIGERLWSELSDMQVYVTFCSCQLNAAALLQHKTNAHPHFRQYLRTLATNYRCKGMPLSSFFLKPMQRITRYPLLIKNILEHTLACHPDVEPLRAALERAEEVCCQVNEGVREKENSEQLDWIQTHVQCEGAIEHLVFNSQTNCLGPRKLLHSGRLHKTKSTRELWVFLFNDFLLFTQPANPFSSSPLSTYFTGADKLFSTKSNTQLKMYKTPLFLNEVLVKMPSHLSSDEPLFHISHIDRMYTLKTDTMNERTTWVQRIKAASEHFIETQKRNRERAYQARSLLFSGVGRLTVVLMEAQELKACRPDGKMSNPYCQLTVGAQCYTSRPVSDTPDPKWNFTCHFFIQDLYQDVLSISVSDKNLFSPDEFLGRTAVPVATIKKDMENMGAATRRLLLHEAPTGEVWVKLDLQLYDQPE